MTTHPPLAAPVGCPVLRDETLRHALLAGARVLTAQGERCIDGIQAGDRIISRDFGMVEVRDTRRQPVAPGTPVVRIPAGSLGRGRPEADLSLLPDQPVALRGWRAKTLFGAHEARVAAARLVDGKVICWGRHGGGAAYSLVLDMPSAIYADGLELVSAALDAQPPEH